MSTGTAVRKSEAMLTDEEQERFARLEAEIRPILGNFLDVAEKLYEIAKDRLYRDTHDSFEAYLDDRWGMSRSWGNQLVKAHKAVLSLPPGSEKPASVRAALGLARGTTPEASGEDPGLAYLKANGYANATVERPEPAPDAAEEDAAPEPSPTAWLEALPERAKLSERCRRLFDLEAAACERLAGARKEYRDACRRVTEPLEKECKGVGPWLSKHHLHFKINGPEKWRACADCGGSGFRTLGGETGQCGTCKTMGYHV